MTNYAVTTKLYGPAVLSTVSAAMEAYLETIDNTKTIYRYDVYKKYGDIFVGLIVHAT